MIKLPDILLLHDWLMKYAGSESVVEEMLKFLPVKEIKTLFRAKNVGFSTGGIPISTTFLDKFPGVRRYYRYLLPFYPMAVKGIDVSGYKLILSSSHSMIKCVEKSDEQLHICYCYSPPRYLYDLKESYFSRAFVTLMGPVLDSLAKWDTERSSSVDHYIGISRYISDRIKRVYGRESEVIYPPCRTDFGKLLRKEGFFLTASRFVPYKRVDLLVKVFSELKIPLVVVGDGPEEEHIRSIAAGNIRFEGWVEYARLNELMKKAEAFVFASEEDFGIVCVEAQACGTPVICYNKGGQSETVIDWDSDRERATGVYFRSQDEESIAAAIERFNSFKELIRTESCLENAKKFSADIFRTKLEAFIRDKWGKFQSGTASSGTHT